MDSYSKVLTTTQAPDIPSCSQKRVKITVSEELSQGLLQVRVGCVPVYSNQDAAREQYWRSQGSCGLII